jgi:hypothetical protein
MAQDVIITPADGEIEWQDNTTGVALIDIDANNNLSITNAGGNLSIGDGSSDVYIGNGVANVDLVFEQDGEIRGTGSQTLTLGTSGDTIKIAGGTTFSVQTDLSFAANPEITWTSNFLDLYSTNAIGVVRILGNASYAPRFEIYTGIGTSSPAQKLNITDGGILMTDENGGQPMFQARNYATSATGTFDNTYGFEYRHASSFTQIHGALIHLNENNNSRRTLTVSSGLGTIAQFTSAFYVGIATANPKARMQVVTTSDTSGTPTTYDDNGKYFTVGQGGETGGNVFISYDNTNNRGYIGALSPSVAWRNLILNPGGGNVGIGTTSPDVKLHVSSGDIRIGNGNKVYLYESNSANYLTYNKWEVNTSTALAINNAGTGGFQIQDAGTAVLFVGTDTTYGGKVGIGTTTPSVKLEVKDSQVQV